MFFIYLFCANKLYLWDVKRKVNKILARSENLAEEQLVDYVRQKGGVSNLAVFIYIIVFIAFFILLLMTIYSAILMYL